VEKKTKSIECKFCEERVPVDERETHKCFVIEQEVRKRVKDQMEEIEQCKSKQARAQAVERGPVLGLVGNEQKREQPMLPTLHQMNLDYAPKRPYVIAIEDSDDEQPATRPQFNSNQKPKRDADII
jgi:hypothetical protein